MLLPTITELDRQILSSPPFVHVEGVINIRALGGYRITDSHFVKPSIIFRSGDPSKITADGKEQLRALGVTKFFDLRDESEIVNYGSRMPAIDGIEFVRVPIPAHGGTDAESMRDRFEDFDAKDGEVSREMYDDILKNGGASFRTIFTYLRDNADIPCIVHCSGGKDRTGVFSALLLSLLGVDEKDIIKDYTLTTVGLKPVLPMLYKKYQNGENLQGLLKLCTAKVDSINYVLRTIRDRYGGVESYWTDEIKLYKEDLDIIRGNLLIQKPSES